MRVVLFKSSFYNKPTSESRPEVSHALAGFHPIWSRYLPMFKALSRANAPTITVNEMGESIDDSWKGHLFVPMDGRPICSWLFHQDHHKEFDDITHLIK